MGMIPYNGPEYMIFYYRSSSHFKWCVVINYSEHNKVFFFRAGAIRAFFPIGEFLGKLWDNDAGLDHWR